MFIRKKSYKRLLDEIREYRSQQLADKESMRMVLRRLATTEAALAELEQKQFVGFSKLGVKVERNHIIPPAYIATRTDEDKKAK